MNVNFLSKRRSFQGQHLICGSNQKTNILVSVSRLKEIYGNIWNLHQTECACFFTTCNGMFKEFLISWELGVKLIMKQAKY